MIPFAITAAAFVAGVHLQAVSDVDQGLTLAELVANIPHDPSAMVVYAMLFGSILFIWRASRSRGQPIEMPRSPDGESLKEDPAG